MTSSQNQQSEIMTGTEAYPTTLTSILPKLTEKLQSKQSNEGKAEVENSRNEILTKYGDLYRKMYPVTLNDYSILAIHKATEENKRCEKCEGKASCFKTGSMRGIMHDYRVISGQLNYSQRPCKFFRFIPPGVKRAEIPEKYRGLTWADYEVDDKNKKAWSLARWIVENPTMGLFIYGSPGVGKTLLAAIMANEYESRGKRVIFTKVSDFLRNIRATFDKDSKMSEMEVLQKFCECDCLILDDVRPECGKKFASEQLFELIDSRYNAQLPTVITSNGTMEEVRDALNNPTDVKGTVLDGDRIYDRCAETMKVVKIEGESRRRRI